MNGHVRDARSLLKEALSASEETRQDILREAKEIIEFVLREES